MLASTWAKKNAARARSLSLARAELEKRCGQAVLRKIRRQDPRFGKFVRALSADAINLADALNSPISIRSRLSHGDLKEQIYEFIREADTAKAMSISEEIDSIFGNEASDKAIILRLGLTGLAPLTLQEAGEAFGISRERVRQKQERIRVLFEESKPYTPVLDRGMKVLKKLVEAGIDNCEEIEEVLRSSLLLGQDDNLKQLLAFAELTLGKKYDIVKFEDLCLVMPEKLARQAPDALEFVKEYASDRTRDAGACQVESLVHALFESAFGEWSSKALLLLSAVPELQWLETNNWFRIKRKWNRLVNLSQKILAVSPTIRISLLRKGLMRSLRVQQAPPSTVLAQILVTDLSHLEIEFDGKTIAAKKPPSVESVLSPLELLIFSNLDTHDGIMTRESLEDFVCAQGMNRNSFQMMIAKSVFMDCLAKGVYSLRGRYVQPGVVENLLIKGNYRRLVTKDFGSSANGRIWLKQCITDAALRYGSFGLPASLQPYIAGRFDIHIAGKATKFTAKVSSGQIRFGTELFASLEAEINDFILLWFDAKACVIELAVGDEDIAESMQADLPAERYD